MNIKATILAALIALGGLSSPSQAATLTYDLRFTVDSLFGGSRQDLLGSKITGTVSFDDALLDETGSGRISATEMNLSLSFMGQIFSETDASDFPILPFIVVSEFGLASFLFSTSELSESPTPIDEPKVLTIVLNDWSMEEEDGVFVGSAHLQVSPATPIPVPAAAPLLIGSLALMAGLRARRRRA